MQELNIGNNDATNNYKSIVGAFAYTSMVSLEEKMNQVMM